MIREATLSAATQNAQTLNVLRLKANQMLSESESEATSGVKASLRRASPHFTL